MRFFLTLIATILVLSTPLLAQTASDQPDGKISVEDSAEKDAAIAVRIREILEELEDYKDVTVTVSNGIVQLRGTTLDSASVTKLGELASRIEGVVDEVFGLDQYPVDHLHDFIASIGWNNFAALAGKQRIPGDFAQPVDCVANGRLFDIDMFLRLRK